MSHHKCGVCSVTLEVWSVKQEGRHPGSERGDRSLQGVIIINILIINIIIVNILVIFMIMIIMIITIVIMVIRR